MHLGWHNCLYGFLCLISQILTEVILGVLEAVASGEVRLPLTGMQTALLIAGPQLVSSEKDTTREVRVGGEIKTTQQVEFKNYILFN